MGTHPLTINYSAPDASTSTKQLQLSYSVNEVITVSGPIAKDNEKMKLYTSEIEGSIELNLRDYIFDPAGLDFIIPDTCYEADDVDCEWRVDIKNDNLRIEYRFEDDPWNNYFSISFKVRNSYHYVNKLTFTLYYVEPTGITEEKEGESDSQVIYNMNGQRFTKKEQELLPGVYIINGVKRVVLK